MKGVIICAIKELVKENFGEEKWKEILKKANLEKDMIILPTSDFSDEIFFKILSSLCNVLNISIEEAAKSFAEYWVLNYSQKIYKPYYETAKSAKDFLLKMDEVHFRETQRLEKANPPRFDYKWKDEKTLIMTYKSKRNLIAFMIELIKAVGKYYKENLIVEKISDKEVQIKFL